MTTGRKHELLAKYVLASRSYAKRRPRLRRFLVRLRGMWLRLEYLYLVLGRSGERKTAEEAMPVLRRFAMGSCSIAEEMREAYREYSTTVSSDDMAISHEVACLLWSLCEALKPARILDMGSGFSSFVFRRYQSKTSPRPEVWSVDENAGWLEKTREYLGSRGLSDDHLFTWGAFQALEPPRFDLISHDLGYMSDRPGIFEWLLGLREPNGVIVVDDFQKPAYRAEITKRLQKYDTVASYSLRWLTLDKHMRYSLLVVRRGDGGIA